MATGPVDYVAVTEEHFLEPLGLPALRGILPERRRELFVALAEYLDAQGLVVPRTAEKVVSSLQDAELRVPGTPVHVRLSGVRDPQLHEIVVVLGAIGLHADAGKTITVGGLLALGRLVSILKTEYGERSIVDVLQGATPPTPEAVTGLLHGSACRHPGAGCRYAANGVCTISIEGVSTTLNDLAGRGIVRRLTAVEPLEFTVTV